VDDPHSGEAPQRNGLLHNREGSRYHGLPHA
jgi:hypothetical protein